MVLAKMECLSKAQEKRLRVCKHILKEYVAIHQIVMMLANVIILDKEMPTSFLFQHMSSSMQVIAL